MELAFLELQYQIIAFQGFWFPTDINLVFYHVVLVDQDVINVGSAENVYELHRVSLMNCWMEIGALLRVKGMTMYS